ncbi:diaminopimelate decarboxylase [Thermocoleostomius sinensis]|uniref:Diaminopimelate decarboxylase n=1 Tax=Thermocoleostomius sinensis A174 TaxID=2016057 RepID=A0A9E8ZF92_9CYAN|nr:diaminopimelate decarboxylase [Thermocoleostomius sinensis]WAL60732.1 diaminopimelate decarboxylase [Thermocoleostomius sinensis A174]
MIVTSATEAVTSGRQYLPTSSLGSAGSPNQSLLPLTATVNKNDHLEVGGCDVPSLVRRFGSPLYILDEETLRRACRQYHQAFQRYYPGESLVIYASKAWNCLAVCAIVASEGLGIDVVSGGELYTALRAGMNPEVIYFHGNNKSIDELQFAVEVGCTIVVDNWLELETLARMQDALQPPTRILLRLTPGIECHTHDYIRTGHLDSKFGFDPDQLEDVFAFVSQQPALECVGLHAHIGSQIFELQPHQDLTMVMMQWMSKAATYNLPVRELDIGGGLGIRYTEQDDPPSIDEWVRVICEGVVAACETLQMPLPKLIAEPGRSLIGSACVTAYTVGSQKVIPNLRTYVTVDGGMSDNPRPITYQSIYRAVIANRMSAEMTEMVAVAGKHCESGDIVIKEARLPQTKSGDTLVVMGTGAYNYSMASNYNRLPRPAAVLVNAGEADVILKRESYQDLIQHDCLPEKLVEKG